MAQTGFYHPHVSQYPNVSVEEYLWLLNQDYAAQVVPAVGLLAALMGLGVVGNCLVLWVYTCRFQRRIVTSFIQALAVFDLLSCCLAMPGEIFDMTNNYTFGRNPLCKIVRTVNLFCSMASGATLVVVAVDRYRRICLPFRPQISARGATTIIICCSFISLVVSLPALILIGGQTVATDWVEVNGTDCSISDKYVGTMFPLIYNAVQLLLFLAGAVTLIVLYSLIGSRVYRHVNQRQARQRRRSMARSNFLMPSPSQCSSNSTNIHGEHHTASNIRPAENATAKYPDSSRQQDITSRSTEAGTYLGHPDDKLATKFYSVSKAVTHNTEDETINKLNYNRRNARRCNSDYTNRTYQTLFSFLFDKDGSPSSSMTEFQESCTVVVERKVSSVKTEKSFNKRKQAEAKLSTATFLKTPEMKAKHAVIVSHSPPNTTEANSESNVKSNGSFGDSIALNTSPYIMKRDNSSIAKSPISDADVIALPPTVQAEGQIPVLIIDNYSESDQTSKLIENGNKSLKPEVGISLPRIDTPEQKPGKTEGGSCPLTNQVAQQNTYNRLRHSQDSAGVKRATLMLFMITVVYVTSFLPHLVLMTLKALGLDPGDEPAWQLAHNLLIRSYFINSVANPVIYSFFSKNFFTQCRRSACRG